MAEKNPTTTQVPTKIILSHPMFLEND